MTVTSETATKQLINDVRNAALTAIEKQVPNAPPVTITATLYVVYGGVTGYNHSDVYESVGMGGGGRLGYGDFGSDVPTGRVVASTSATPWADGFIPVVGQSATFGVGSPIGSLTTGPVARGPITWMRVSYTIADANGHVIEAKEQWQPANRPRNTLEHILPSRYDSARVADTAAFLAARVAALSH